MIFYLPEGKWRALRWIPAGLICGLLGVAGCNQNQLPPPIGIVGVRDLALVDDKLFVTSTDRGDLRVLGLSQNRTDFIRAPNPVEPLSIPVLDRPVALAKDIGYDDSGQEVPGPYIYAQGAADAEISVIATDRALLLERFRIPASGIVTAIAARAPLPTIRSSTLYFGAIEASGSLPRSTLWKVSVPLTAQAEPLLQTALSVSLPGETISSLVVMPNPSRIAVAVRGAGNAGRSFIFDEVSGATTQLKFPTPVRYMITNPGTATLSAGAKIYGILDEAACGTQALCGGVLVVDTCEGNAPPSCRPGEISADDSNTDIPVTMLPLVSTPGLITGLALAPGALLNGVGTLDLLGIISSSLGGIYFFDGVGMRAIDASTTAATANTPRYLSPSGASLSVVGGPVPDSIVVNKGTTRDEDIAIVYQGRIPGLIGRTVRLSPDGRRFFAPGLLLAGRVQPGDTVELASSNSSCALELAIDLAGSDFFVTRDPAPAECDGQSIFAIRAGDSGPPYPGLGPYVVSGNISGYMGRVAPGIQFSFRGTDYFHPSGYTPNQVQLAFTFGDSDPAVQRDNQYLFHTSSYYAGYSISISSVSLDFNLPGSVVYYAPLGRAYVAYPSSNSIVQITPSLVQPNVANGLNIAVFR